MSNDMPDKIYLWLKELQWSSEFPISHKIIADHIAGHVQQLIKEAEERQREKCAETVNDILKEVFLILDDYSSTIGDEALPMIKSDINAISDLLLILNAGGE